MTGCGEVPVDKAGTAPVKRTNRKRDGVHNIRHTTDFNPGNAGEQICRYVMLAGGFPDHLAVVYDPAVFVLIESWSATSCSFWHQLPHDGVDYGPFRVRCSVIGTTLVLLIVAHGCIRMSVCLVLVFQSGNAGLVFGWSGGGNRGLQTLQVAGFPFGDGHVFQAALGGQQQVVG